MRASLDAAGVEHIGLGGVRPNPEIGLAREGVELARANDADIILPVGEQLALWRHIPHCRMELIVSDFGHDGFLVEHAKLDAILGPFIES